MPAKNEFVLECTVHVKPKGYKTAMGKILTEDMVYLVPFDSSMKVRFYNEYLPATEYRMEQGNEDQFNAFECIALIEHPVHEYARISLMRPNANYPENAHFFVMSMGAEEVLKRHIGKTTKITIYPEMEADEEAELGL